MIMSKKGGVIKKCQVDYTVPNKYKNESQKALVLNGLMTYSPYHPDYFSIYEEQVKVEIEKPDENVITTYKDAYER